jgi:peroxiredoxin family protein
MDRPLAIFLHSARYDRIYQAASLLLTAASLGRKGYLFLFYGALATYASGEWDDPETLLDAPDGAPPWAQTLRRAFALSESPSPYEILDMARKEPGGLTVCACSTSMKLLGLQAADVRARVDEIVGHATMLDLAADAQILYI